MEFHVKLVPFILVMLAGCSLMKGSLGKKLTDHYDRVLRCERAPFEVQCCSRQSGPLSADWSSQTPQVLDGEDVEVHLSQHPLDLQRGATFELHVVRDHSAAACNDEADNTDDGSAYVRLQLGDDPHAATSSWVQFNSTGLVTASYAGDVIKGCATADRSSIFVDIRPGHAGREDRLLGSLGVIGDGEAEITWYQDDFDLGAISAFARKQYLRFVTSRGYSNLESVDQYQGSCGSASAFESMVEPLTLTSLGVEEWATSLGEAAFVIAPGDGPSQETWDLIFSGEHSEAGKKRRRSLGYSRSFKAGSSWVPVPNSKLPIVMSSSADEDLRDPAVALGSHGERVVAFTAGGPQSYLQFGQLHGSGDFTRLGSLRPESFASDCSAIAHPSMACQSDGGFKLYFTCCSGSSTQCGGGETDSLWMIELDSSLDRYRDKRGFARRVEYDKGFHQLLESGHRIVSAEALRGETDEDVRLWVLLQDDQQQRSVYLLRAAKNLKRFELHTDMPVLAPANLCPSGAVCNLDSVAVARTQVENAIRMLAVISNGSNVDEPQTAYVLGQSWEVPP